MGSQQQQQFCLRWSNHQSNMLSVFDDLLRHEALVDVTIACDGVSMKAHKVVLSACSPFFQHLFLENPCQHPIVILKDTKYAELKALVDFMYKGEVNVTQEQLSTLLKTAETLKIKGLAEVTGGMNGQQQQHENDDDDGGGNGNNGNAGGGDGLLTPPPPLERPQQFQVQQQQRSTVDGRTLDTSSSPTLPLPPPPPPQTAHLPPPLQLPSAIVSPPQSQSLRLVSKGIAAAAAASSLSITIPTSVSTASDSQHNVSSRSPSSPPPSKRKKTRHRRRSSDGGGGGRSSPPADDCGIEMQGSPELIEAKVEVTSPDEEFEESQITRRPHRTRRLLAAIASAAAAARSTSMEHEHDHEHEHDEDERRMTTTTTTRTSLPDPQTDSNQESMDNLYAGQGPSSAPPSGEEYNLSIGGDPMSGGAAGGGHLLMKIKSPIPSTSSQGDPLAGGIVQRHEYGGSGSGGDRGTTSGGSGYIPKRGQPRILNESEEINIVTYIVDMAAKGRPVTRRCVLEYGNTLLRRQDRIPTGSIHCNPEKGLSNDWWKEFKKRHPGLPVRAPTSSSSQPLASSSTQLLASTSLGDGGGGADWSRMVEDSESDCPKDQ